MPLERLNMVCLVYAASLLFTGCTQFVEPFVLGSPSSAREGMKQAPLPGNDLERSPNPSPSTRARLHLVKSHAETSDTQTSGNAVAVLETREGGQGVATSREVVEVANTENSAVAFLTGPAAEAHAMTGTEETPSVAWSGGFMLALAAMLLLYTRLFRRRAIQNTPTTPLVKLLHTRPWR